MAVDLIVGDKVVSTKDCNFHYPQLAKVWARRTEGTVTRVNANGNVTVRWDNIWPPRGMNPLDLRKVE